MSHSLLRVVAHGHPSRDALTMWAVLTIVTERPLWSGVVCGMIAILRRLVNRMDANDARISIHLDKEALDAIAALRGLGWPIEACEARVAAVAKQGMDSGTIVKAALKGKRS